MSTVSEVAGERAVKLKRRKKTEKTKQKNYRIQYASTLHVVRKNAKKKLTRREKGETEQQLTLLRKCPMPNY